MARPKKSTQSTSKTPEPILEAPSTEPIKLVVAPTLKEELLSLHAQMTKHGIHSIGQLEVKISQQ